MLFQNDYDKILDEILEDIIVLNPEEEEEEEHYMHQE